MSSKQTIYGTRLGRGYTVRGQGEDIRYGVRERGNTVRGQQEEIGYGVRERRAGVRGTCIDYHTHHDFDHRVDDNKEGL